MKFKVLILAEAETDIDKGYVWCELKQFGLGA